MGTGRTRLVMLSLLCACGGPKTAAPPESLGTEPDPAPPIAPPDASPPPVDAAPSPPKNGPKAGINLFTLDPAWKDVDSPPVGKPFPVPILIHLDHALGYVQPPTLEVGAHTSAKTLARTPVATGTTLGIKHTINLDRPGPWAIELYAEGSLLRSFGVELVRQDCASGPPKLSLHQRGDGATLTAGRIGAKERFGLQVSIGRWAMADEPAPAIVEWLRNGKRVHRERAHSDHFREAVKGLDQLDANKSQADWLCSVSRLDQTFTLPARVPIRKGKWEVRIHRRGAYSAALRFIIVGDEATRASQDEEGTIMLDTELVAANTSKTIAARLAAMARKQRRNRLHRKRSAELRAVIRSEAALDARVAINAARKAKDRPQVKHHRKVLAAAVAKYGAAFTTAEARWPPGMRGVMLGRRAAFLPVRTCAGIRCRTYPAMSSDGRFLVMRDYECLNDAGDGLPSIGKVTRHYKVNGPTAIPIPSRNMSGYRPLVCNGDMGGGYAVKLGTAGDPATIRDPAGKVVKSIPGDQLRKVCGHPARRTAIVVRSDNPQQGFGDAPGDDCGTAGGARIELVDF